MTTSSSSYDDIFADNDSMSWSFCNQEHEKQCLETPLSSSSSSIDEWESKEYQYWLSQDSNLFEELPFAPQNNVIQSTQPSPPTLILKSCCCDTPHTVDTLQLTAALKEEITNLKDEMKILKENFYYYFPETGKKRRRERSNFYTSPVITHEKQKKQRCV